MIGPAVKVQPNMRFGRPHMNGVSTEMIADLHWAQGETEILDDYDLTRHELLVALWFEATQGQPRFRRRWKAWGAYAAGVLWKASEVNPEVVELPPRQDEVHQIPEKTC